MAQNNSTSLQENTIDSLALPTDLVDMATRSPMLSSTPLRKRTSNTALPSSGGSIPPSPTHKRLKTSEEGDYTVSALDDENKPPAEDDASATASLSNGAEIQPGSRNVGTQVITGDTPVFGMKAEMMDGSSFQLFAQIFKGGPYVPLSDVEIDRLKEGGYTRAISAVLAGALKAGGEYRRGVAPRMDRSLPTSSSLKPLAPVYTTGDIDVSPVDALTNMLRDVAPQFYNESLAEILRAFRDEKDSIIDVKSLSGMINNQKGKDRLELRRIKKLECGTPFGRAHPLLRQEAVLDLASKGHMLIVVFFSKRHLGAPGKYVGVANGKVYDNDEVTGGIYDLKEYAAHEWAGVSRIRIVAPL